ncbi:MAG: hydrogenase small subunit [Thiobacillaceae bacterium]|jgi:hydrogenase small subunit|nr:hydrogenase small subunit [Thiobacillaceae bacterium]
MVHGTTFHSGLSRRAFLRYCALLASSLALPPGRAASLASALARKTRPAVIWYALQGCSGCTESLTRADDPDFGALILDQLSLDFHPVLQAAAGEGAEAACRRSLAENRDRYLLVVEGSVPLGAGGAYAACAGQSGLEQLREAAANAAAVLAVGSCATFGGLPAAAPNPTGARGVSELMDMGLIARRPLANLPGCPPLPLAMSATLAHWVAFGGWPELDRLLRPRAFYGETIHDRCPRLPYFLQGLFAERFDDEGARQGWCLFKLGCKGPATRNACASRGWNGATSFPVQSGHPCLGCSEPGFWDGDGFYRPLRGPIPIAGLPSGSTASPPMRHDQEAT